jgi:arginine decarboxylase-like protein
MLSTKIGRASLVMEEVSDLKKIAEVSTPGHPALGMRWVFSRGREMGGVGGETSKFGINTIQFLMPQPGEEHDSPGSSDASFHIGSR